MAKFKNNKKYYLTVEGETEKWYFEWLMNQINACPNSEYKVSIEAKIQKNPLKFAKAFTVIGKTEVYHISDYESDEKIHTSQFIDTMDNLKKAKNLGKQIDYKFGYSNFTFDLWIVLHYADCNGSLAHRSQYLSHINKIYHKTFESMDEYKHEDNFKGILQQSTIANVIDAINRAKKIMERNKENGYVQHQYKGYKYYKENPSLAIWEAIEKILKDCKLT